MRISQSQDFLIGRYRVGGTIFDAIIFGHYEGKRLMYAARTRNGFTPAVRATLMRKFQGLETGECLFANLPESKGGRWSEGLTAEKMKECRWLKPYWSGSSNFWNGRPMITCDTRGSSHYVKARNLAVLGEEVRIDPARKPHAAQVSGQHVQNYTEESVITPSIDYSVRDFYGNAVSRTCDLSE
jgi:hypothetical protein